MKFKAPWGIRITFMTLAVSLLLLGIPTYLLSNKPWNNTYVITICTVISVFLGALLFIIRGYTIYDKTRDSHLFMTEDREFTW